MPTEKNSQLSLAPDFLRTGWPQIQIQADSIVTPALKAQEQILFCGCGDSHHAAHSLGYAAATYTGVPALGIHSMEAARYWIPTQAGMGTLVIGISASGEVARTIEAIEQAKRVGCRTVGLTTNSTSNLALIADQSICFPAPDFGAEPGLLSYLSSLLMGFALVDALSPRQKSDQMIRAMDQILEELPGWIEDQKAYVDEVAKGFDHHLPLVFLASGPAYGSAQFGSAKYLEATGCWSWSQDIEEWAHLEYFCDPSALPIWILSAGGSALSREEEVFQAARAIGRKIFQSRISQTHGMTEWERELSSPFLLWAGPYAFSLAIMQAIGETPFRGFSGGRSVEEGGGASRIRSSWRMERSGIWKPDPA